jgi:hypothetical protein
MTRQHGKCAPPERLCQRLGSANSRSNRISTPKPATPDAAALAACDHHVEGVGEANGAPLSERR